MTSTRLALVRDLLEGRVDDGRLPGFVAAVRHRGATEVLTGGLPHLDRDEPMTEHVQFRLASLSKPFAGVLALALAEDGVLALDDPVDPWLPELIRPRVLRRPGGDLDDILPADRPITVRHLLTSTPGFGGLWDGSPLDRAMTEGGLAPGPFSPDLAPDEYLRRLGELPLAAQPGTRWLYHTSADVLSVLLARASGRPLGRLLAERITGPLELTGTGFTGDPARLATLYEPTGDGLGVLDPPDGRFAVRPPFEGLAAGLVSTAPDVLAFLGALADGGTPVLSAASVRAMTADALTAEQRAAAPDLGDGRSWGFQVGVAAAGSGPGRWGWDGGTGTSGWVDPGDGVVGVLLTQRLWSGPDDAPDDVQAAVHTCVRAPAGPPGGPVEAARPR